MLILKPIGDSVGSSAALSMASFDFDCGRGAALAGVGSANCPLTAKAASWVAAPATACSVTGKPAAVGPLALWACLMAAASASFGFAIDVGIAGAIIAAGFCWLPAGCESTGCERCSGASCAGRTFVRKAALNMIGFGLSWAPAASLVPFSAAGFSSGPPGPAWSGLSRFAAAVAGESFVGALRRIRGFVLPCEIPSAFGNPGASKDELWSCSFRWLAAARA